MYGGRRVGQVRPSYQNRQISALDETADAPQSSLFSPLSSLFSLLLFLSSSHSLTLLSLSLSSFSVSLSVSLCLCLRVVWWSCCCGVLWYVMLCCVVVCVRCGVWCVASWKTPCVHSTRLRVYVQYVPWCRYKRGRFARTHGDVLNR